MNAVNFSPVSTLLSVLVGAGFLWSVILFFSAVFMDEREQEAGFGWALFGAVLYFITFADRLPGAPIGLRNAFEILPGVTSADADFRSPWTVLVVLLLAYVIRLLVFYQLVLEDYGRDVDGDGREDDINDLVAPFLSYLCWAICAVTALWGVYDLNVLGTAVAVVGAVAIYFSPRFLFMFRPYLELLFEYVRSGWMVTVRAMRDGVVYLIDGIIRIELNRRGRSTHELDQRVDDRRIVRLKKREEDLERRKKKIDAVGNRVAERRRPRPPAGPTATPKNPNVR